MCIRDRPLRIHPLLHRAYFEPSVSTSMQLYTYLRRSLPIIDEARRKINAYSCCIERNDDSVFTKQAYKMYRRALNESNGRDVMSMVMYSYFWLWNFVLLDSSDLNSQINSLVYADYLVGPRYT